ncbi:MAG: fructosamine kinase family protein [Cyanobium sp.]
MARSPFADPAVPHASDPLAPWLAQRLGVRLVARSPVGGGCIHSAWRLSLADGGRLFAKTGPLAALPLLESEADGLAALAAAADPQHLAVPAPLALAAVEGQAVLVLPWLELGAASGRQDPWRALGGALAALHRRSLQGALLDGDRGGVAYGWGRDNHIGATPQANGWLEEWGPFFVERRLAPQIARLARREGPLAGAEALLEQVPRWLAAHRPEPCLVHGDLWSGNAGLGRDGRGCLFDPSVHRADREVDLAMAHLFNGFPPEFFQGYESQWPLPAGHRQRRDLYNLYHLLNHANLFGGGYSDQARRAIAALLERDDLSPDTRA